MNKSKLITAIKPLGSMVSKIKYDSRAAKNALFFVFEWAPVSSFVCLIYTALAGNSVYGTKISSIERSCVAAAAPLSLATHIGFFKKCGISAYECLRYEGCGKDVSMNLLYNLDNNPGWTMTAAFVGSVLLYLISKSSDVKALLSKKPDTNR